MKRFGIIIGTQKAATTFIHHCLAEHPQIFSPLEEYPLFEYPSYNKKRTEKFLQTANKQKEPVIVIKRPLFFIKPESPRLIKKHIPNAKLILILRNPIDRAVAGYLHNIKMGLIPPIPINLGLGYITKHGSIPKYPRSNMILKHGLYFKHMQKYLKYFDRKNISIMIYKDVKKNNAASIKQLYKFLGVDANYQPKAIKLRPQKTIYSFTNLVLNNIRSHFLHNISRDHKGIMTKSKLSKLDTFIISKTYAAQSILKPYTNSRKVKISKKLKTKLYKYYEKDINEIEVFLKRDLQFWKY